MEQGKTLHLNAAAVIDIHDFFQVVRTLSVENIRGVDDPFIELDPLLCRALADCFIERLGRSLDLLRVA